MILILALPTITASAPTDTYFLTSAALDIPKPTPTGIDLTERFVDFKASIVY